MAIENRVQFSFDARYFNEGDPEAERVWLCLHGYWQLAPYFIRKFSTIALRDLVIVPEGLHRFYTSDGTGRVVASWMTKEDREKDIQNYLSYLDAVMEAVLSVRQNKKMELILFGFSQGVATACRFYAHTNMDISNIILWAGALPPDLDMSAMRFKENQGSFHLLYGDKDPYMKDSPYTNSMAVLEELGYSYDLRVFSGEHEIKSEELKALLTRLDP